ncbi:MAG: VIT domain-containing protein [Phycisphaerae bacterium]|nr:VIT domain-containing protein [Phycisphaerae bacterium]
MNNYQFQFHTRFAPIYRILDADEQAPPPHDELDSLLRDWHREHADIAAASRARILATAESEKRFARPDRGPVLARIGHALTGRIARVAACIGIVGILATVLLTPARNAASASSTINVAEGGELTAFGKDGDRLGPCPLQHTDVDAEVTGPFTRVTLKQRYSNPFPQKIEAIYTFPMSHRAAVDQMRIIVKGPTGERVVEGEVKEREAARQIYENAKASGYVASLLEQERTNIFTQRLANIEPGSTITVEIGYIETLERKNGVYSFAFPMTVGPRYVPGAVRTGGSKLPDGLVSRAGLVLLGPAQVEVTSSGATMSPQAAQQLLAIGMPIRMPTQDQFEQNASASGATTQFVVTYANGAKETGEIYAGGSGHVNGRWFWYGRVENAGTGFADNTDQVPDASRVTPMPVKPSERAGHDVSVRLTIDSGGAAIRDVTSELHEITSEPGARTVVTLKDKTTIPNRDFIVSWKSDTDLLAPGVYANMRGGDDATKGGYFAVILDPPARVEEKDVPARELVFVLDTSGSMNGFPIEKAKEVMTKAIAAMRPQDTFNVITFAGSTNILWTEARSANDDNKRTAQLFVNERHGGGGTEMMSAINAALKPLDRAGWLRPKELADLPADGRAVRVSAPMTALNEGSTSLDIGDGKSVRVAMNLSLPTVIDRASKTLSLEGQWLTKNGDRVFAVDRASFERASIAPTRIVMFLTDGLVANEGAIMQAVRDNAKTTRVFSFGIGQSVNRSLLDGIALEGRGASEIITLAAAADPAVARFVRRIQSPVLVDIEAKFAGVEVTDVLPNPEKIPDLFDETPLILVGRYAKSGHGMITLRGVTGAGAWERTIELALPERGDERTAVPTLWARAKVESVIAPNRTAIEQQRADAATRDAIVRLGEAYQIMTPFTSFVAVERSRVTIGGAPMLVQIPIELPEGTSWRGFFGEGVAPAKWFAAQAAVNGGATYDGVEPRGVDKDILELNRTAMQVLGRGAGRESRSLYFLAATASDDSLADMNSPSSDLATTAVLRVDPAPTGSTSNLSVLPVLGEIPAIDALLRKDVRKLQSGGGQSGLDPASAVAPSGAPLAPAGGGGAGGGLGGGQLSGKRHAEPKPSAVPPPVMAPAAAPAPSAAESAFRHLDAQSPAAPGSASAPAAEKPAPSPAPSGTTAAPTKRPASAPIAPPGTGSGNAAGDSEAATTGGSGGATDGTKKDKEPSKSESEAAERGSTIGGESRGERGPGNPKRESQAPGEKFRGFGRAGELADTARSERKEAEKDSALARDDDRAIREQLTKSLEDRAGDAPAVKDAIDGRADRALSEADRNLLARRIERTLLALALAADIDASAALDLAKTARPALSFGDDGTVRVTILVAAGEADATQRMATALRSAGVAIEAIDPATRIIVANVRLNALIDLALRDAIRRIEPLRAKPAVATAK